MAEQNETVEIDQLEKSLKALVDTAQAGVAPLTKGGVENSGFEGLDGKQGGGQGSASDAGSIDNMMIAKMKAAGIPAGIVAKFAAFMQDEGEDEDDEDAFKSFAGESADLNKSLRSNPKVAEMLDVTPFLDDFTTQVGEHLTKLHKSVAAGHKQQSDINVKLAQAVHQLGTLVKSQAKVIDVLGQRLGIVEKTPVAPPKGKTRAAALHKSMPGEAGAGDPTEQLRKSEVLATLTYMNLEKGISEIGGRRTSDLVVALEAGGVYDQATHAAVVDFLRKNPEEAPIARQYT